LPDPHAADDRPEHPELFISYASEDLDRATALHRVLAAEVFCVWFDKVRLTPGCDWHEEIEAGCEAAHVILPLVTPRWTKSANTPSHDLRISATISSEKSRIFPVS
jgi:hypothetical protein